MNPQGGNPIDDYYAQKSGIKKPSGNPIDDYYSQQSSSRQQEPEEDLTPGDELQYNWLGRMKNKVTSAMEQAASIIQDVTLMPAITYGKEGFGIQYAKPGQTLGRMWDAVGTSALGRVFDEPIIIKDLTKPNANMFNPANSMVQKFSGTVNEEGAKTPGFLEQYAQAIGDPVEFVSTMAEGLYDQTLGAGLTAISGKKPNQVGGIVPATPQEQYDAMITTASTYVMMKAASAISNSIMAKVGTDADLLPTIFQGPMRVGRLGKVLGAEGAGMVVGGVAGSLVKGDEVTLKAATEMILSPASIIFTALGGAGKLKKLKADQRFIENTRFGSMDDSGAEYVAAQSMAANVDTPLNTIAEGVTSLATSDGLVAAAINTKLGVDTGFLIPSLSREAHFKLVEHYSYNTPAKNPEPSLVIGKKVESGNPVAGKFEFESYFDRAAYRLGATRSEKVGKALINEIKAATGLDEAAIRSHADNLQNKVKSAVPLENGKGFVKAVNFDPYYSRPELKPVIYRGPNNETYVAPGKMAPSLVKSFEETGFFPEELVSVNGKNAVLKKWNPKFSIVDFGMGEKRVATPNMVRRVGDQLTMGAVAVGDPANPLAPKAGLQYGVLTAESYLNKVYGEFRASLDDPTKYTTFNENLLHHFDKNSIPIPERGKVQQYFYKKLHEEAFATHTPEEQMLLKESMARIEERHLDNIATDYGAAAHSAMYNGFYFDQDSGGFTLKDVRTDKLIRKFSTLKELKEYTNKVGQTESVYTDGGGTGKGDPAIGQMGTSMPTLWAEGTRSHLGSLLMPVARQIEWLGAESTIGGTGTVGVQLQQLVREGLSRNNGFMNYQAFGLKKSHDNLMKLGLNETESANISAIRGARGLEELRNDITPDQALFAEKLVKSVDLEAVKGEIIRYYDLGPEDYAAFVAAKKVDPAIVKKAEELRGLAAAKEIDHRVMRYATALEHPETALSREALKFKLKQEGSWTTKMGIAEKLVDDFFDEAVGVFGIADSTLINDYISMVRDYGKKAPKIDNIWVKNGGMNPDFIYELNRAGWTPTESLVQNIESIVHSYLTAGVRAKSGMTANINQALKLKDSWIKDLEASGSKSGPLVAKTVDGWINSIRGIPDPEAQATRGTKRVLDRSASYASDWFATVFLGARPVMGAADAATTFIMSYSKYSSKLTLKMIDVVKRGDFNEKIRELEAAGETVQTTASAVLARAEGETTFLSKTADIGIKMSLQEKAYKYSYGSTYIATKELFAQAEKNSMGSKARLVHDLGDVLEGNTPSEIRHFHELIDNNQHASASKLLASINARVVANEYGKVNNPLKWQNSVGRLAGQFGSWGANASTSLVEMYAGKSWQYSARASLRLAASNGAVVGAATALGVSPSRFIVTPFTVVPGLGPTGTSLEEVRQILNTIGGNENERAYAEARLIRLLKSQIPLAMKNAYKSHIYYTEQDEKWKAFMQLNGFKVNPD